MTSNTNNSSSKESAVSDSKEDCLSQCNYKPHNLFVNACLTDLYQITMTYAYWKNKKVDSVAVFDLFFRKCPFKGEFCIFAGLDDVLRFLNTFHYSKKQISLLRMRFPLWDPKFWDYMSTIDASNIRVLAQREGSVVFAKVPLLRVEGPITVCQLIETTLLNLVNYASLITTNAARIRNAVGPKKGLLEFGLRRAQGPDGAMSASRYAYIGGFNGTSNVLAALLHNIPLKGTHAHSFVSSFHSLDVFDRNNFIIPLANDPKCSGNLLDSVLKYRKQLPTGSLTNDGELAAFIAYAYAFPNGFLALVDTYSTLESGIVNYAAVALALYKDFGYKPIGIRLDSGDLAYLSVQSRIYFNKIDADFNVPLKDTLIVASNDINEEVLHSLKEQGHEIDTFGIGTHLVTCKRQPALGCVYKLVEIDGMARIKLSQTRGKTTIPGKKLAYRLFIKNEEQPILDLMVLDDEQIEGNDEQSYVAVGKDVLCESPFDTKLCKVYPYRADSLLIEVWNKGKVIHKSPSNGEIRDYCMSQVRLLRDDYLRSSNPTPYKVAVSSTLKKLTLDLIRNEMPVVSYK